MLTATIALETASRSHWDVIVVGGGPAGGMAAYQLAKRGLRTLLVERKRFPRDKVCGGCINGRAISTLNMVGLGRLLSKLKAIPIERFQLRCGGRRGEISLPAGVAVSRSAFDTALVRAAVEVGADFLPQTKATLVEGASSDSNRVVQLVQHSRSVSTAAASVVLLADGLGNPGLPQNHPLQSRIATHSRIGVGGSMANVPAELDGGTIFMAVGKEGYAGLVQIEDGRLNVAAALDPAMLKQDCRPAAAVASILQSAGFPEFRSIETIDWTGTVPLTRRCRTPAGHRVLLLGDAAGYVEPFTGEGIACALTSGVAASRLVAQHLKNWIGDVEREWCRQHRELFDKRQRWCRGLARMLWHPWAIGGLLSGLAFAPWLAGPIVRRLNERPAMSSV